METADGTREMFEAAENNCIRDKDYGDGFVPSESSGQKLVYEQPLNEHVRAWLRLEYLFCHVEHRIKGVSSWDSRAAVAGLIDILEFVARNDIKPELIKDIEKHIQTYQRWREIPGVDEVRLNNLLHRLKTALDSLSGMDRQPGRKLYEHPLLASVRQRSSIPGGTCRFDVPAYHYWLQAGPKQRSADLREWLNILEPLRTAIDLDLYLIRNNARVSVELAKDGFFQAKLDNQTAFQIIRISLPGEYGCYPEISGGKHRFSVRFFEYRSGYDSPVQTGQDVSFELYRCMI